MSATSAEQLDAAVAAYEAHNPQLNAVVVERIDSARRRSAAADAATARGDSWGPLHGVPMTVKEVLDWVDAPSTWGVEELRTHVPERNAVVVDRLLDAGAVIWGKTNVPPMLMEWQTHNPIHGQTSNPWDLTRTPGGSSGGSAAAVASGMTRLEVGSDIGGSIRLPAHYCGVYGHKPTFGLVDPAGHTFPGQDAPVDVNVVGPLAASPDELETLLRVMSGPMTSTLSPAAAGLDAGLRVAVKFDSPYGDQDDEMMSVLDAAVRALSDSGCRVEVAEPDLDPRAAFDNYLLMTRAATSAVDKGADLERYRSDAERYRGGDRDYEATLAAGVLLHHREWVEAANARARLQRRWAEFFTRHDVLLCPAAATCAAPLDRSPFDQQTLSVNGTDVPAIQQWFWFGYSGGAHLPSTVAPVGVAASGLPVGIQIVGPLWGDLLTIDVARRLRELLGPLPPPPLTPTQAGG